KGLEPDRQQLGLCPRRWPMIRLDTADAYFCELRSDFGETSDRPSASIKTPRVSVHFTIFSCGRAAFFASSRSLSRRRAVFSGRRTVFFLMRTVARTFVAVWTYKITVRYVLIGVSTAEELLSGRELRSKGTPAG
ncbi:MAG: hypothetical protein AAF456_22455, partial [Planctomycetota bacterium]